MPVSTISSNRAVTYAGSVLQIVHGTTATKVTNSTSTYADTGLSATITPTSATSKILILISHPNTQKSSGNSSNGVQFNLVKNGTQIREIASDYNFTGTVLTLNTTFSFTYYDSPASTSALTYKTQFRNGLVAGSVSVQDDNFMSTITLLEIAG
jgi:hypothetical protein